MLEGGHGPYASDELVAYRDRRGAVRGVSYFGTHLVLAADDDAVVDAFAVETRKHPSLRSFVGPKPQIDGLWDRVSAWYRTPTAVRERQPLYALLPADLPAVPAVGVRRARPDEAEIIVEQSAEMIVGELGYDPRGQRAGYAANVRRAIALGLWWVWFEGAQLRFQCNVGPRTTATAQIQGVWVPPDARGRGYARAALGSIARALLGENATLSLYVNDFNRDAIRLYEGLGFRAVGAFATYLFP